MGLGAANLAACRLTPGFHEAYDPSTGWRTDTVVDSRRGTSSTTYDLDGRLARNDSPEGTVRYEYDPATGWKTRTYTLDPADSSTRTDIRDDYDETGRLVAVRTLRLDDATVSLTTDYAYDKLDRPVLATQPNGTTESRTYDALGRLKTVVTKGPSNAVVAGFAYGVDKAGRRTSVVESRDGSSDRTVSYAYDALGRLAREAMSGGATGTRTIDYAYDLAGNRRSKRDSGAATNRGDLRYSYDGDDRLTGVDGYNSLNMVVYTESYTYDDAGNTLTVTGDAPATYTWDLEGRMATATVGGVTTTYAYDDSGIRVGATAGGQETKYIIDPSAAYTPVLEERTAAGATAATYVRGLDLILQDRGGTLSYYTKDGLGSVRALTHSQGSTTLASYTLSYDDANRLTGTTSPDGSAAYGYDRTDQLTAADRDAGPDESYSYDLAGNRTMTGYDTDPGNLLRADGTYTYDYDAEGNRIRRTEVATGEVTEYQWDYRNRLVRVGTKTPTGDLVKEVRYTYDAMDRRVARSVDPDGDGPAPAERMRFAYDGDAQVLAIDPTGRVRDVILQGPAVDQALADDRFDASGTAIGDFWALGDWQGSVRDVIDSTGAVLDHIAYDSFGRVTAETAPSVAFPFGYTGQVRDAETGLSYYKARYYDAAAGRFLSRDPLGLDAGDMNQYRYVGNRSTDQTDPTGMWTVNVTIAVSGLTSGLNRAIATPAVSTLPYATHAASNFVVLKTVGIVAGIAGMLVAPFANLAFTDFNLAGQSTGISPQIKGSPAEGLDDSGRDVLDSLVFTTKQEMNSAYLLNVLRKLKTKFQVSIDDSDLLKGNPCDLLPLLDNTRYVEERPALRPGSKNTTDYLVNSMLVRATPTAISTGSDVSTTAQKVIPLHGYEGLTPGTPRDNSGHVLGNQLGGPGGLLARNLFPEEATLNQYTQRMHENAIRASMVSLNANACIFVNLLYVGLSRENNVDKPNRPDFVAYTTWGAHNKSELWKNK